MPVYELKDDELVNFPWSHGNLDEWLYRPIKIKGRKIERLEMNFRRFYGTTPGCDIILPIVTKEDDQRNFDSRSGIMINLGWASQFVMNKNVRIRQEDSFEVQEFIGYVSDGEQYRHWFGKKPNICCEQMVRFGKLFTLIFLNINR